MKGRTMLRYLGVFLIVACTIAFAGDLKKVDLTVSGMHCSHCTDKVKSAIKKVNDVQKVDVNLKNGTAKIMLASNSTASAEALAKVVADAGYDASYQEGKETKTIAAVKTDHDDKDCVEMSGKQGSMDCKEDGKSDCCMGKTTKSKEMKRK